MTAFFKSSGSIFIEKCLASAHLAWVKNELSPYNEQVIVIEQCTNGKLKCLYSQTTVDYRIFHRTLS